MYQKKTISDIQQTMKMEMLKVQMVGIINKNKTETM